VLTVSWLDGEKLSQSKADNVGDLVNIGVICYLKQLLDTGFFHADPHPGNLIRTPDGRLAILDFGLVSVFGEAGFWNHLKQVLKSGFASSSWWVHWGCKHIATRSKRLHLHSTVV
jgi:predicted unusual protein kinase regulating ubiquinone biosynthesis (AarF/ABC1/UbiB family)